MRNVLFSYEEGAGTPFLKMKTRLYQMYGRPAGRPYKRTPVQTDAHTPGSFQKYATLIYENDLLLAVEWLRDYASTLSRSYPERTPFVIHPKRSIS